MVDLGEAERHDAAMRLADEWERDAERIEADVAFVQREAAGGNRDAQRMLKAKRRSALIAADLIRRHVTELRAALTEGVTAHEEAPREHGI